MSSADLVDGPPAFTADAIPAGRALRLEESAKLAASLEAPQSLLCTKKQIKELQIYDEKMLRSFHN